MKRFLLSIFILILAAGGVSGEDEWARVSGPRAWTFPRDFGVHPQYRTEWWYFTGNLRDDSGSQFGYQLTFFRQGLRARLPSPSSLWDVRDVYLAHFAVTDISRREFRVAERVSRTGPGLAGADAGRMNVWLLNWSAQMKGPAIDIEARDKEMELSLHLSPRKPPVIHGAKGFSRKGPEAGQASYYASLTDLETRGRLKRKSTGFLDVSGVSWFDQEFGSNQLTPEQTGWDWFGLHLEDGRDLMIYMLRLRNGGLEPASSGTLVLPDGTPLHLRGSDFAVSVLDRWKSPRSGGEYPSRWRIQIPAAKIDLTIAPQVSDQELQTGQSTGITYWEGAVTGKGSSRGRPVSCRGYVELTGYAGSLGGRF